MGGHPLKHDCRGRADIEALRERDQLGRWDEGIVSVRSWCHSVSYTVTFFNLRDLFSDGIHDPCTLHPRGERHLEGVNTGALIGVNEVKSYGLKLDPCLPCTWLGQGDLFVFHDLGSSSLMDTDGFHSSGLLISC